MPAANVLIVGGDRLEDLTLLQSARELGIVSRAIIVGNKCKIAQSIEEAGVEINQNDIVNSKNDEETATAAVELIKAGGIDILLKGNISTPVLNKCMLPLAVRPTVSLVSIFEAAPIADGRPMILTDAGFTTVCDFGRMVDLVRNAIEVAQLVMGIDRPKVAILSANEKQIASLPSTRIGLELARHSWPNASVCGPLSFDLASDPQSVAVNGLPDLPGATEVAGQADVLVCPGIDSANILYKAIAAMTKYGPASIAGITVGFTIPYIIISRTDTPKTRLESIALCTVYRHGAGHD